MSKNMERPVTKTGKPMSYEIQKTRLAMAVRLVPEVELAPIDHMFPREALAAKFGVTSHDILGLEEYYELPPRSGLIRNHKIDPIKVDQMAERVWELIAARVDAKIDAAFTARFGP